MRVRVKKMKLIDQDKSATSATKRGEIRGEGRVRSRVGVRDRVVILN